KQRAALTQRLDHVSRRRAVFQWSGELPTGGVLPRSTRRQCRIREHVQPRDCDPALSYREGRRKWRGVRRRSEGGPQSALRVRGAQSFKDIDTAPGPRTNNYPSGCIVDDSLILICWCVVTQIAVDQISCAR